MKSTQIYPFWTSIIVILMAIGTVWMRLYMVRMSYEIDQADKLIQNAKSNMERLELEVAQLRSPQRLEKLAKRQFHLALPATHQIVYLRESK